MQLIICGVWFSFLFNLDLAHSVVETVKDNTHANVITGLLHNVMLLVFAAHYYYTGSVGLWNIMRILSMGYLIADSIYFYIIKRIRHSNIFLFHHIIFILGWIVGYDLSPEITSMFYRVLLAETSSVTLNLRNLAKIYQYPKLDLIFSVLTFKLFFIFRVLNFTLLFPRLYFQQEYLFLSILIPLTLLQYYWFILMIDKVRSFLKKKNNRMEQ